MAGATRRQSWALALLLLALLLLAAPDPAAALFGRKKKEDPAAVEAKARAALEESMKADAAAKKGEPPAPPKPKAKAGVTARKVGCCLIVVVWVCVYVFTSACSSGDALAARTPELYTGGRDNPRCESWPPAMVNGQVSYPNRSIFRFISSFC